MARNKYIYIVVRKWYYRSNGVDTAGCIGNDDIHSFGTLKSAKEYVESEIYACKSFNDVDFEQYNLDMVETIPYGKTIKSYNYSQPTYSDKSNTRYAFTILKHVYKSYLQLEFKLICLLPCLNNKKGKYSPGKMFEYQYVNNDVTL
jgi:hypothetical protein